MAVKKAIFFIFALVLCLASMVCARKSKGSAPNPIINVINFGAVGDGKSDDTQAFSKAWSKACDMRGLDVTFLVPSEKSFLLGPIQFEGPCKASRINVQVWGTIIAPCMKSSMWKKADSDDKWIEFKSINGLTLSGSGKIDGQGSTWWDCRESGKCSVAPYSLQINNCNNIHMRDLTFVNPPQKHIAFHHCVGIVISHLTILAPGDSPNTDGIYTQHCTNIVITNSTIATGDDCISIGTGCAHVKISKITCGPGHGISIGSLGKDEEPASVEDVRVWNCSFTRTMNAMRIKTYQGGSGYARGISFEEMILKYVDNPIIIDQYYCNGEHDCGNQTSAVKVSNVAFVGVTGTSTKDTAINLACSETVGCTDIRLEHVHLHNMESDEETVSYCLNANGKFVDVIPPVHCIEGKDNRDNL